MTIIDRSEEKETSTSFLTPSIIRNSRKTKKDILIKLLIFSFPCGVCVCMNM